jgi:enolase
MYSAYTIIVREQPETTLAHINININTQQNKTKMKAREEREQKNTTTSHFIRVRPVSRLPRV